MGGGNGGGGEGGGGGKLDPKWADSIPDANRVRPRHIKNEPTSICQTTACINEVGGARNKATAGDAVSPDLNWKWSGPFVRSVPLDGFQETSEALFVCVCVCIWKIFFLAAFSRRHVLSFSLPVPSSICFRSALSPFEPTTASFFAAVPSFIGPKR